MNSINGEPYSLWDWIPTMMVSKLHTVNYRHRTGTLLPVFGMSFFFQLCLIGLVQDSLCYRPVSQTFEKVQEIQA